MRSCFSPFSGKLAIIGVERNARTANVQRRGHTAQNGSPLAYRSLSPYFDVYIGLGGSMSLFILGPDNRYSTSTEGRIKEPNITSPRVLIFIHN